MATLPAGVTVFGPLPVPAGTQRFGLLTAIENWPTANTGIIATLVLELSFDSGGTWREVARFQYTGGLNPRTGLPPLGPHPSYALSNPAPAGLLFRVTVDLAQSLTGTGTLEIS
jgi:hypothetical protein